MLRSANKFFRVIALVLFANSFLVACTDKPQHQLILIGGDTMGTSWSVKITDLPASIERDSLKSKIESELLNINASMSTYLQDSEITQLNRHISDEVFPISEQLNTVIAESLSISRISDGAFDITIGPLVNLWGFGPVDIMAHIPDESKIQEVLSHTGANKILYDSQSQNIKKLDPKVYIDLSAIAKGYAVDRLAKILDQKSIENYMVEIGGELRVRGINGRGLAWVIAVEKPDPETRSPLTLIEPGSSAVATSGDYRNYFEKNGIRYSHTIDPATGKPITHNLASVSVISEQCMTADALATALLVMGAEKGLTLAKKQNLAVLFIIKTENGFESFFTEQFNQYLK